MKQFWNSKIQPHYPSSAEWAGWGGSWDSVCQCIQNLWFEEMLEEVRCQLLSSQLPTSSISIFRFIATIFSNGSRGGGKVPSPSFYFSKNKHEAWRISMKRQQLDATYMVEVSLMLMFTHSLKKQFLGFISFHVTESFNLCVCCLSCSFLGS